MRESEVLIGALQHEVLYMPVCREGRFNREGVAAYLDMPLPPRPLSPLTYTTIGIWAPLVSCPPDCKGYRNRSVAKLLRAGSSAVRWLFERKRVNGSSTVQEKKWWERPLGIVILTVIAGLILWGITRHFDKPTPSTSVEQPKAQPQPAQPEPKAQEQHQPTHQQSSDKKKTKIEQHGEGSRAVGGNINQGPCSNLQIGEATIKPPRTACSRTSLTTMMALRKRR